MKLHPKFITGERGKRFAVIPFEEYQFLKQRVRDYEELRNMDEAAAWAKARADLGL